MKKKIFFAMSVGIVSAVLALVLFLTGILNRFEATTWTWRVKYFAPRTEPLSTVQTILVDQDSLEWASKEMGWSWPWPREAYTLFLSFCKRANVKGVAFDILFTEPSKYGVDDDRALGESIRSFPCTIVAGTEGEKKTVFPIPEIRTNATCVANVLDRPGSDGIFRKSTLKHLHAKNLPISLGGALWQATHPQEKFDAPLDSNGKLLLQFTGTNGLHRAWRAAAILQSEMNLQAGEKASVNPSELKDAYILIGFSAPGLMDIRPTPISRILPGVEIHATLLDNLLSRRFLQILPTSSIIFSFILLSLLVSGIGIFCKKSYQSVLLFLAGPVICTGTGFLFYPMGYEFPIISSSMAMLLAAIGSMILNYADEGRQKAFIKKAFRHYLGEEVINQMLDDPKSLKLGGERRVMTIYFSDIQRFSTFSERLTPEELTKFLNIYLSEMGKAIQQEGGYVDKYIGDAVVAFWNAPITQEDHAARACRAAIQCQRVINEKRAEWKEQFGVDLHVRIGLNTGEVLVGNMGSKERFNYTILGDAVNLASRLEGANKAFGTWIMISEDTKQAAGPSFQTRPLANLRVVGRKHPIRTYEVAIGTSPSFWKEYENAVALFDSGKWQEALENFKKWPDDSASLAYIKQCEELIRTNPKNWDGVWKLTEK